LAIFQQGFSLILCTYGLFWCKYKDEHEPGGKGNQGPKNGDEGAGCISGILFVAELQQIVCFFIWQLDVVRLKLLNTSECGEINAVNFSLKGPTKQMVSVGAFFLKEFCYEEKYRCFGCAHSLWCIFCPVQCDYLRHC